MRLSDNSRPKHPQDVNRILIYRLGSIGDMVVSLPCFHLVRRCYPDAEITLLTNQPVESRAAPAASILDGSGLVDKYLAYPVQTRSVKVLAGLVRSIRSLNPDLLIYLIPRSSLFQVVRDYVFFHLAGVRSAVGYPFRGGLRRLRPPASENGYWEPESGRLARCIVALGDAETGQTQSWDLNLSAAEIADADRLLERPLNGDGTRMDLIGLSVGTKQARKDWGDGNWRRVLADIMRKDMGLVLLGSGEERSRCDAISSDWPGAVFNLCGSATPRVSAAVMKQLQFLLCIDSGPMHLASAAGARCVAVFTQHDLLGKWFPFGSGHRILYPGERGGNAELIEPETVIKAAQEFLSAPRVIVKELSP
jgi:ADP-heptose:LPS heptosyltransferase